jgi:hypothetical protein
MIVDLSRLKAGLIEKRPKNKIMPTKEDQNHFLESYITDGSVSTYQLFLIFSFTRGRGKQIDRPLDPHEILRARPAPP